MTLLKKMDYNMLSDGHGIAKQMKRMNSVNRRYKAEAFAQSFLYGASATTGAFLSTGKVGVAELITGGVISAVTGVVNALKAPDMRMKKVYKAEYDEIVARAKKIYKK